MGLKFHPRPGHLVGFAAGKQPGQLVRYAGREFVPGTKPGQAGAWRASAEPVEVPAGSADAEHFIRQARKSDPGLWPADEATAAACGVEFVELEQDDDGEWVAVDSHH